MSRGPWIDHFGDNFLWSNATLILKGMAPYGVVSLEEMDRACEKLRARQGEADRGKAWFEEWRALGDQIEKQGDAALAQGRQDHRRRLLSARRHLSLQRRAIHRAEPGEEGAVRARLQGLAPGHPAAPSQRRVRRSALRGHHPARAVHEGAGAGPAPTVVVLNGMDNAKEMSMFFCGLEFARRGYNTLCLDGPGMGETRRMRDMASRYDYEVPGGAALDYLLKRPEVDGKRVAIMGYSFGGYYSSRIAAFEKRYAACIALSALHWDLAAWQQKIKDANKNAPKSVAQSNFQWRWVAGAKDEDEGIEIAKKFSLKDVAKNITCPFLVTHGGNDRVVPVENAQKLYDAVGSKNKTIKIFTTEEGGAEHAHVDNRQIGIDFAADWLEKNWP